MKLNNFITEDVLDLEKWHVETTNQTIIYWYFIDVKNPANKIGVFLYKEGDLYVDLSWNYKMKALEDRSKPINKPPLIKLKDPIEKRTIVRRIFSLADKK